MDDFSFKVLGTPDGFDLPLTGETLSSGKAGWALSKSGHDAEVKAPVDGVITHVNPDVRKSPGTAGHSPYYDGWLFTVHADDPKKAVKELMGIEESQDWLDRDVGRLEAMIEETQGPLATDGGLLRADVFGALPSLGWGNLIRTFF